MGRLTYALDLSDLLMDLAMDAAKLFQLWDDIVTTTGSLLMTLFLQLSTLSFIMSLVTFAVQPGSGSLLRSQGDGLS